MEGERGEMEGERGTGEGGESIVLIAPFVR